MTGELCADERSRVRTDAMRCVAAASAAAVTLDFLATPLLLLLLSE